MFSYSHTSCFHVFILSYFHSSLGGATVVAGASPGQQATPTSLTQTVILSIAPNTSTGAACGSARLSPHSTLVQATPPSSTPSTPPFLPLLTPSLSSSSLPPNLLVTLLRCFGPLQVQLTKFMLKILIHSFEKFLSIC